jgi:hypothetical protein
MSPVKLPTDVTIILRRNFSVRPSARSAFRNTGKNVKYLIACDESQFDPHDLINETFAVSPESFDSSSNQYEHQKFKRFNTARNL